MPRRIPRGDTLRQRVAPGEFKADPRDEREMELAERERGDAPAGDRRRHLPLPERREAVVEEAAGKQHRYRDDAVGRWPKFTMRCV